MCVLALRSTRIRRNRIGRIGNEECAVVLQTEEKVRAKWCSVVRPLNQLYDHQKHLGSYCFEWRQEFSAFCCFNLNLPLLRSSCCCYYYYILLSFSLSHFYYKFIFIFLLAVLCIYSSYFNSSTDSDNKHVCLMKVSATHLITFSSFLFSILFCDSTITFCSVFQD